ncbi:hypothetical protein predicted by Glimmer/Critica [Salmonella enterica subsp. enterica serovar Weltevreden str. 2007-60-3289-1]|uniref:Uncharacterized protein n=1 Tax=Salmonella paratyphi B (strain ATCC BAA-1250 / SPB7) TaxID=1016998 RepID=A0A6C6Z7N7_SALPB|nr:hypothetical protein SPAB_04226 [Salmonella enterica subsp. enterica serovar Paratyphi B str. SPB7]CBY97602.1 hypothetical protein predicted by Glimmer/Critica [Salmonella enterica subsp. enterica serovar Weltevreden str. 2007-60-3289-1]
MRAGVKTWHVSSLLFLKKPKARYSPDNGKALTREK